MMPALGLGARATPDLTASARDLNFRLLSPSHLRAWVEAHPGHVDDRDSRGNSPLYAAALNAYSNPASGAANYALVSWLVDTEGADVNFRASNGSGAIHHATHVDVLGLLLDRGADPVMQNDKGWMPLMHHVKRGRCGCVARLLEDPRVRASIDTVVQGDDFHGHSAFHFACSTYSHITHSTRRAMLCSLLKAGADPTLPHPTTTYMPTLRQYFPVVPLKPTLLDEAIDAQRAACLIKARRVAVEAGGSEAGKRVKRGRLERGKALPSLQLDMYNEGEEGEDFGILMAFLMGVQSKGGGSGVPQGAFVVVMGMLIPPWHALRTALTGVE